MTLVHPRVIMTIALAPRNLVMSVSNLVHSNYEPRNLISVSSAAVIGYVAAVHAMQHAERQLLLCVWLAGALVMVVQKHVHQ